MSDFAKPSKYALTIGPLGYVAKPDVTNTNPKYLIRGSLNVLINDQDKVQSRPGYSVYGGVGSVVEGSILGSFDWATSTDAEYMLRSYIDPASANSGKIQFVYSDTWYDLVTGLSSGTMEGTKWWDNQEKLDVALLCNGTPNVYEWSGGVAEVDSVTANTITKTGTETWAQSRFYFRGSITGTTIAFVNSNPDTITDSGNGFITAGFRAGQKITVSGATNPGNNATFTIRNVTAGTITLLSTDALTAEAAGASVTIISQRQVTVPGKGTFTYTGGEGTTTLTGVTPNPSVAGVVAGDIAFQTARTQVNVVDSGYNINDIEALYNQVYYLSTVRQDVYISDNSNYFDFIPSSPRLPGEGDVVTLDGSGRSLESTEKVMYIGAGQDDVWEIEFILSADLVNEIIQPRKLQTSRLQAPIGPGAMAKAKNYIVSLSYEPVFNLLGRIENINIPQSRPLSDIIKNDLERYDFDSFAPHISFWRDASYLAVPADGVILIYDWDKKLWQAPQTMPVSRFSVYQGWLYGHSSIRNETYKLFDVNVQTDRYIDADNIGDNILFRARFAYNSFTNTTYSRANPKNFNQYWTEGYISSNTLLTMRHWYDYKGSSGIAEYPIDGSDECILYRTHDDNSLGKQSLGKQPLGSLYFEDDADEEALGIYKFRKNDTSSVDNDFFELMVEYETESEGAYFEILSHGPDVGYSDTIPTSITK
jgi:hypothetical protein